MLTLFTVVYPAWLKTHPWPCKSCAVSTHACVRSIWKSRSDTKWYIYAHNLICTCYMPSSLNMAEVLSVSKNMGFSGLCDQQCNMPLHTIWTKRKFQGSKCPLTGMTGGARTADKTLGCSLINELKCMSPNSSQVSVTTISTSSGQRVSHTAILCSVKAATKDDFQKTLPVVFDGLSLSGQACDHKSSLTF